MTSQAQNVEIAAAFRPLFTPKRYKIYFGGRGGAKSWAFAQALIIQGAMRPIRILCTRELQQSIQESVHKLISDTINRLGLHTFYEIQQSTIKGRNGTQFIFSGLRNNTTQIKSMEAVDIVWCEEAEVISEKSWDILIPTIRKSGSEIWVSFNPADELDATYQRFVTPYQEELKQGPFENELVYVAKVGWQDNPWFPSELREEMELCKANDYQKYLHIWEGECNANYADSLVKPEWFNAAIDAHKRLGFKPQGVKTLGFDPADEGTDAKALIIRHGSVVTTTDMWTTGDVADAIEKAWDTAYDHRCTDLVYDGIGIGAAVKVKLKQSDPRGKLEITNFVGGESVRDPEMKYEEDRKNKDVFRNLRAQFYWHLRDRFESTYRAIERGDYIDPDKLISIDSGIENLAQLRSEVCRVQRKRGSNTYIQVESKEDMKKREMPSPNLADALMMAFANNPPKTRVWEKLEYPRRAVV